MISDSNLDSSRKAIKLTRVIENMQSSFNAITNCKIPVIACVSGICLGGAIDMISACDIVVCDSTAVFSIKEVDIGMTPDLGTINRLTHSCKDHSLLKELTFTGRNFGGGTAKDIGLVSTVFANKNEMMMGVEKLAGEISKKSPTAIYAIKKVFNFHKSNQVYLCK